MSAFARPIPIARPSTSSTGEPFQISTRLWSLGVPLAALALTLTLTNAGYIGGGADDWWYLKAARCWAANGSCLADTHWAARLPVVVPMAATLAVFGEGWRVAGLVPLAYAIGCVALLSRLVGRAHGPLAGCLAGLALVATPAFARPVMQPSVDAAELFWLLAGLTGLLRARRTGWLWPAAWAGVALGLACVTRMTAVTALPFALVALPPTTWHRVRQLVAAGAGATLVLGAEAAGYWWATGDPLRRLVLSLGHTRIPSTRLAPSVPLDQSPILNPAYIDGWAPLMGIELHWTVDGVVNLLASPEVGATLLAAGLLAFSARLGGLWRPANRLGLIAGCAAVHVFVLIYVLAIDPTPRMVFVELAVAAAIIGVLGARLWDTPRRPLVGLLGLVAVLRLSTTLPLVERTEALGEALSAFADPAHVAVDEWTHRTLTLDTDWRAAPVQQGAQGRDLVTLGTSACALRAPSGTHIAAERTVDGLAERSHALAAFHRVSSRDEPLRIVACRFTQG